MKLTTVTEAFEWMVSFTNLEKKPDLSKRGYRLDKMYSLLNLFNNPHEGYPIIHIAGSKGKGSTAAFISSILHEAGYKTGVYSSPHLLDYRERIKESAGFFSENSYLSVINDIKSTLNSINPDTLPGGEPTTFELMTLAAFMIFKLEQCDWVVLETGIGGRLDSTNVVDPVTSVITSIELEHTDLLGDTLELIASEKAGIIKKNRPIFTSNNKQEVIKVLNDRATEMNSPFKQMDRDYSVKINNTGTTLQSGTYSYNLGLQGEIQAENAQLAIEVIRGVLPNIDIETIQSGLSKTTLPGRFHNVTEYLVLDGAHTINSIRGTIDTFKKIYGDGVIIFGAVIGKDVTGMVEMISREFDTIFISRPGTFKESNIEDIKHQFIHCGKKPILLPEADEVLNAARKTGKPILVTGSFYMAGEIKKVVDSEER